MRKIFRASAAAAEQMSDLGLLAGLTGKWVGQGFNLISLPDFDKRPPSTGPRAFRVLMNSTLETLEFTPIGGAVPNRGAELPNSGQPPQGQADIDIFGLRYLQTVSDANTHEALHVEPGFWLSVPATTIPAAGPSIVRQGTIPHGVSILLQGSAFNAPDGKPHFDEASTTPFFNPPGGSFPLGYLDPLMNAPLPPPLTDRRIIGDPNVLLQQDIAPFFQDISATVVLQVDTLPDVGLLNIPFLKNAVNNNAAATRASATFWIETVTPAGGKPFRVLQYTQTVILNFLGVDWPHVSVGTLMAQ